VDTIGLNWTRHCRIRWGWVGWQLTATLGIDFTALDLSELVWIRLHATGLDDITLDATGTLRMTELTGTAQIDCIGRDGITADYMQPTLLHET
jgi:hypothetical protein